MRRLHTFQKCNFPAVLLRHFFGCGGKVPLLKNAVSGVLFFLVFLINFGSFSVMGQNFPSYLHESEVELGTAGISSLDNLIISIDTDQNGHVYILTFGNGVKRYNPQTGDPIEDFIEGDFFDSPTDISVDDDGFIYVTDYLASGESFHDDGKIWVFDSEGNSLTERTILTSFYRPVGIDVDNQKVYVAEYYDGVQGPEKGSQFSRVRIYDKNSGEVLAQTDDVEVPFRIAADSDQNVYVSQAGPAPRFPFQPRNGSVKFFDSNLNVQDEWDIRTPGSIVVDEEDFIYVIDYVGIINFSAFIQRDVAAIFLMIPGLYSGIENNEFKIRIFKRNGDEISLDENDDREIDFPLDIAFDPCSGNLFLNDAYVESGQTTLEFNLEIFQRTPSLDTEAPVIECPEDPVILTPDGNGNYLLPDYDNLVTDNCDNEPSIIQDPEPGSPISGSKIVTITAEDKAGNIFTCSFQVKAPEEEENPTFDCNASSNLSLELDEDCTVEVPDYSDYIINRQNFTDFDINQEEVITGNLMVVTLEVFDGEEYVDNCIFEVALLDVTAPIVTSCDTSTIEMELASGEKFTIPDYTSRISVTDSCDDTPVIVQDPPRDAEISESTTVRFTIIDASGNETTSCSFEIIVTETPPDPVDPTFDCNAPSNLSLELDEDCTVEIPDYSDYIINRQNFTDFNIKQEEVVIANLLVVTLEVFDGEEYIDNCQFEVSLLDVTAPVFTTCIGNEVHQIYEENGQYIVPDFRPEVEATDNCTPGNEIIYTQSIPPGTPITAGTYIHIFAYDEYNNESSSCSFEVELVASPEAAFEDCPEDIMADNDIGICGAEVSFPMPVAFEGETYLTVNQIDGPSSGSLFSIGETIVTFEAIDSNGDSIQCSFSVNVEDVELPVMDCPDDLYFTIAPEETSRLVNFSMPTATDNCDSSVIQTRGLPSGSEFPIGNHTIEFTATDPSGNDFSCSFEIVITTTDHPDPLPITCPEDQIVDLNGSCDFILPDYQDLISTVEGAAIDQSPAAGTIITENTTITFTSELDGETVTCSFEVQLINQAELVIHCLQDHTEEADADGNFVLPNYRTLVNMTGNCGELSVTQDPPEGTVVDGDTVITLSATDENNNFDECSFRVTLVNPDETDPLAITCPEDQIIDPGNTCEVTVPDFKGMAQVNDPDAVITQSPTAGTVVSGITVITLTATLGDENISCSFDLIVESEDNTPPVASCVEEFTLYLNQEGYGILSAEILDNGSSDNCGPVEMSLNKTRFETSDVGVQPVILTVTDASGNSDTCTTMVTVVAYEEGAEVNCTEEITIFLSETGDFELRLNYTGDEENIDVEISKSYFTCDDIGTQVITATYWGEFTGSCDINVTVVDDIDPVADCIREIDLRLNDSGTASLSAEDLNRNSSDNCGISEFSLSKENFTMADVGTQEVVFTVTDESGNSSTCTVAVNVLPPEGVEPVECVDNILVRIGADGSGSLNSRDLFAGGSETAEYSVSKENFSCDDLGTQVVTATYSGDYTFSCDINVTVVDEILPVAQCIQEIDLRLNASGTASLEAGDLNLDSSDNCGSLEFSLDKNNFTSADVGTQQVIFTATDDSGNSSTCTVAVNVLPYENGDEQPLECVDRVLIQIGANGRAVLNPRKLFTGGSGTAQYSVDRDTFTCNELGENTVTLTYSTPTEEGSCEIVVIVEDPDNRCQVLVEPQSVYIILYPNPSEGQVRLQTSPDLIIYSIEVFDMRGRYLFTKFYEDNSNPIFDYRLDLREYQSGVYPLLIRTNSKDFLKRAIIKN